MEHAEVEENGEVNEEEDDEELFENEAEAEETDEWDIEDEGNLKSGEAREVWSRKNPRVLQKKSGEDIT